MGTLTLDMFTQGVADVEAAQYRILAALSGLRRDFRQNTLYPALGDLIELSSVLETIQQNRETYRTSLPQTLTGVDLEKRQLMFNATPADEESIARTFELLNWAVPFVKELTDEGVAMFEFVHQSLSLDPVGIMPLYRDEGYVFVPDHRENLIHVLKYELSLFSAESEQYRAMKTIEIEAHVPASILETPEDLKLALVEQHQDMPNPATFLMDSDLDFPFDETILPVAKRKLMRHLIS
ncbi:MAG: hypothetical protein IPH85_02335 [Ignavibacteria bacterium]|nr:hypothetical protein [Ignavibacteria bacterium]MBP7093170.1 hypothetical protein [Candidatus Kapabacteria bacterium]MBK6419498.1 hypothetical protein [Ignavibacteria bacterium]MBK6759875.1 hypothetical protein [Ignavibacteria bacterium]MBK7184758.1 hypothetical protein [Ignavibacteria bacterium]